LNGGELLLGARQAQLSKSIDERPARQAEHDRSSRLVSRALVERLLNPPPFRIRTHVGEAESSLPKGRVRNAERRHWLGHGPRWTNHVSRFHRVSVKQAGF
jgi:hypothetical protein